MYDFVDFAVPADSTLPLAAAFQACPEAAWEGSSSGYECKADEGETTDEEDPPAHANVHNPNFRLQRHLSGAASDVTPSPPATPASARPRLRRGPVMGNFVVDPRKAIVILDDDRLKLYPARLPREMTSSSSSSSSSRIMTPSVAASPAFPLLSPATVDARFSTLARPSPLDVMFGGGTDVAARMAALSRQVVGPPEAFYPFTSVRADGTVIGVEDYIFDDDDDDDDDDDGEGALNLDDFIDFGDSSDSSDDNGIGNGHGMHQTNTETDESDFANDSKLDKPASRPSNMTYAPRSSYSKGFHPYMNSSAARALSLNQDRYRLVGKGPQKPALRSSIHRPNWGGRSASSQKQRVRFPVHRSDQ